MRWPQINFSRVVWTIPAEEAKEDEPLIIPLLPQALEILKRRKQAATNEWVFPGRGRTGHLVEPKSCWRRILEAAGLSNLWLHDLRRTMGSWQAMTGASLPIIGKSLGHAPGSTATSVYARLIDAPVRESMQKATNALLLAGKVQRKR
jgi:integrase